MGISSDLRGWYRMFQFTSKLLKVENIPWCTILDFFSHNIAPKSYEYILEKQSMIKILPRKEYNTLYIVELTRYFYTSVLESLLLLSVAMSISAIIMLTHFRKHGDAELQIAARHYNFCRYQYLMYFHVHVTTHT